MPRPYAPETWVRRPDCPVLDVAGASFVDNVILANGEQDDILIVTSSPRLRDNIPETRELTCGGQWISKNEGPWQMVYDTLSGGSVFQNSELGGVGPTFFIDSPEGRYYFRFKSVIVTSFFVNCGTLFPGRIELEYSDDAVFYYPTQTFQEWGHFPTPAIVGEVHAGVHVSATQPVTIPQSGPQGQDADWLILAMHGEWNTNVIFDDFAMWRSIDYGFTWERVRPLSFGNGSSNIDTFTRNPLTGRLNTWVTPGHYFSDDDGATWTESGSPFFFEKVSPTYHPGATMNVLRNGSFINPGDNIISCDGGQTWGQPSSGLSVPVNGRSAAVKLGPQELLAATRGPDYGINIWWSDNGGETFTLSGTVVTPDLMSDVRFLGRYSDGRVVLVTFFGRVYVSSDTPRGTFSPRTFCPLASANLAAARPLPLCGHPIANNTCA
jgi:hypothetical protein